MEPAAGRRGIDRRTIWIIVVVAVLLAIALVVSVALLAVFALGLMDRSGAHVCGLAAVRRSPAAARLVGTPIDQQGFTAGSSSSNNGELNERVTFTVKGPNGTAFVVSQGHGSPLASHLEVQIGRDQRSYIVYAGPFDCPELHSRP